MRRPSVPSNFLTKLGDVREDLRRLQQFFRELLDWIDVNAGSGTVDIHGQTLKGTPVGADELLIADSAAGFELKKITITSLPASGTISTIAAGTGILVTNPTGPTATVAADFGTGAGKVAQGNDSRLSDARTPTGSAGGDLAGTYPNPTVTQARGLRETAGPTTLSMGAVTDGQFLKRSGSTIISATAPTISIATDIAPKHWYLASQTTQSGGLVDSINDQGSSAKNFTQTGSPRCPTATDSDGNTYLAPDGSVDFYTAGAVADWKFLNDGSSFTIACVYSRLTNPTGSETIIDTTDETTVSTGISLWLHFNTAVSWGPVVGITNSAAGQSPAGAGSHGPFTTKTVVVFTFRNDDNNLSGAGDATQNLNAMQFWKHGRQEANGPRNTHTFANTNPSFNMTLFRRANTSDRFFAGRLYELIIDDKAWSARQTAGFIEYARQTYHLVSM